MSDFDIKSQFKNYLRNESESSICLSVIKTLLDVIKYSEARTVKEIDYDVKAAINMIKEVAKPFPVIAISSLGELLQLYITLTKLDIQENFIDCKEEILKRGNEFYVKCKNSSNIIAKNIVKFIFDGCTILVNSNSMILIRAFQEAINQNKNFKVIVTLSAPGNKGRKMHEKLKKLNIPVQLIADTLLGSVIKDINFIMVDAETVMENGGILSDFGTYSLAMCAKQCKKPFYVLCEGYKFTRFFPISQLDMMLEFESSNKNHTKLDYTSPDYITLIISELGFMNPSEVSYEFQNLYI